MSAIKFRWLYLIMIILLAASAILSCSNYDFDDTAVLFSFIFFPLSVSVSRRFIAFCEAYWYLDPPIRGPGEELLCWYIDKNLGLGTVCTVALFYVFQDMKEGSLIVLLPVVCLVFPLSFIVALVEMLMFGFDDSEENEHLKDNQSIGACWAIGAFRAYYEVIFDDIVKRMSDFEKEHDIKFATKKYVLLAPLSCNVKKTLDRDCESNIEVFGELESLEYDQGANLNRTYKNTVYKITEGFDEFYIVGGFASSLNTLWHLRDTIETSNKFKRQFGRMNYLEWKYHRDCFIKILEHLVKDYPCIFLKYDDKNTTLSAFLKCELLKSGFPKEIK
ncbi:uncharacterized protein LOC129227049 [Uloborus diversus]|uniref:uncharacterized protein LOC129227049 n=1 Tax=Uloborus diversus TaxID=327109 RepID=UPI00240A0FF9|nr:uncharacterized protein LOC129227049 [Uloborus diversus]